MDNDTAWTRRAWSLLRNAKLPHFVSAILLVGMLTASTDYVFGADQSPTLGGDVGLYGELNSMSGRERRRPASLGRLFIRPVVTFGQGAQLQFEIDISTDGTSSRQDINNFGFSPRWRWGELYLGDFSLAFSPLTLSGVRIRGGGVSLHSGMVRFTVLHGTTQRAVESPTDNRAYRRNLSGLQAGIGRESGTSFTLNVLSVKDEISSLTGVSNDSVTTVDSLTGDTTVSPLSVTPQENLVVSAVTNLSVAHDQLVLKSEVSGTAITRDRRSAELDKTDIPSFVTNIFTPRVSSSADYAYTTEAQFNRGNVGLQAGYSYVGPGYVSLGLASTTPDRKSADLGARYRIRSTQLRLVYQRQSNNLIDQKASTTVRNKLVGSINTRFTRFWAVNVNSIYATMNNQLTDTLTMVNNNTLVIRVGQIFGPRPNSTLRSVNLDYTFQRTNEKNPTRADADLRSHEVSVRVVNAVTQHITVTPSSSVTSLKRGSAGASTSLTLGLAAQWANLIRRQSVTAQVSYTSLSGTKVTRAILRGEYRLMPRISSRLEFLSNFGRGNDTGANYEEYSGRLSLTYHFGS